jgi:outer membrane receptor for ferrienterochelin and colicins
MGRVVRVGVVIGTLFGLAGPVRAQSAASQSPITELSLEQLVKVEIPTVVGASRFTQQVIDAPATVTIVTSEEIERFGYRTFADLLRGVRGFYVTYDRNYSYVGTRGFLRPGDYNSRVLLLIDGHRLNDNIYDQGFMGTEFPLDVDLIDRVEVVRGPSSSLYGTNAFFAVINVVTRRGSNAGSGGAVSLGSFNTRAGRATFARAFSNGAEVLLSATEYASNGQREVGVGASGHSVDMDHDRARYLFGSFSKGNWTIEGLYGDRWKGVPTGAFSTALDDPRSETEDARSFVEARYQGAVRGTSVLWRTYYDGYQYDGVYGFGLDSPVYKDFAYGAWWGSEATSTRRLRAHLLTAGAEFRHNTQQDQGGRYEGADTILDDRRQSRQWALYGQDEFKISPNVILSVGVRYDYWPTFGGTTNPRLGLIVKPTATSSIKLLNGTAFRAPNAYELFYYGDFGDTLRPETIRTTELAWEQYARGQIRFTVSGFRYDIKDLISQQQDPTTNLGIGFANIGRAGAAGFEAEVEKSWHGGVQALGSYTFTVATSEPDDEPLSNSPRHLGRTRVSMPLFGQHATVGIEGLYTSERRTITGETTSGFSIANLTVNSRELFHRVRLSFDIDNLFNRSYTDPGAEEHVVPTIPQDGRTARVRLSWHF